MDIVNGFFCAIGYILVIGFIIGAIIVWCYENKEKKLEDARIKRLELAARERNAVYSKIHDSADIVKDKAFKQFLIDLGNEQDPYSTIRRYNGLALHNIQRQVSRRKNR